MSAREKANRRLTASEYVKCVDYIRRYEIRLQAERPTERKLAEEITRELGFPVSHSTIGGLKADAGVTWQPRGRAGKIGPRSEQKARAGRMLRTVAWATIKLYEKLGEPVPDSLKGVHDYLKLGEPAVPESQREFILDGESVLQKTFPIHDTRTFVMTNEKH